MGQDCAYNLNVPGALYPAESSLARARRCAAAGRQAQADFPAKALTPQPETLPSRFKRGSRV